jgi:hypothetical protein
MRKRSQKRRLLEGATLDEFIVAAENLRALAPDRALAGVVNLRDFRIDGTLPALAQVSRTTGEI